MKYIGQTMRRTTGCFRKRNCGICTLSAFVSTCCIDVLGDDAVRLPVVSAAAMDGSLATRWSAQGDGQWIRFELGSSVSIAAAKIAWHRGNERTARFDTQTSADATSWTASTITRRIAAPTGRASTCRPAGSSCSPARKIAWPIAASTTPARRCGRIPPATHGPRSLTRSWTDTTRRTTST